MLRRMLLRPDLGAVQIRCLARGGDGEEIDPHLLARRLGLVDDQSEKLVHFLRIEPARGHGVEALLERPQPPEPRWLFMNASKP